MSTKVDGRVPLMVGEVLEEHIQAHREANSGFLMDQHRDPTRQIVALHGMQGRQDRALSEGHCIASSHLEIHGT